MSVYMYYEDPNTVHTLTIDRLTEEAHVRVNSATSLKEVKIIKGTTYLCELVTVPPSVSVMVANNPCVCIDFKFPPSNV